MSSVKSNKTLYFVTEALGKLATVSVTLQEFSTSADIGE